MSEPTTTGVINDIFQNNLDVIVGNFGAISSTSSKLLLGLATIEFLLFLWGAYQARSEEVIKKAIEKLFLIFVVALLTFNWGSVAGFMRGYIGGGGAGVGGGNSMITSMNPAYIASDGLDKVSVIFSPEGQKALMESSFFSDPESADRKKERAAQRKKAQEERGWLAETTGFDGEALVDSFMDAGSDIATAIVVGLIFCGLAILIVLVHFYVALQLFVLTIDWYLTVAMTNLLIPFAVNKHTSSLASAGFQAVVRKSVQLGVMMAILGMFGNTIQGLGLGPQPTMVDILSLLLGSLTMAFMVKNIPQIASSIFAGGGGTIDVGGAMSAAAAGVASRAVGAMTGGAGVAVGAASSVAGAGAKLAGQGAVKAGGYAGGKALQVGRQLGADVGARAGALMNNEDPGRGGRDAEPKSLSALHESHMNESHHIQNDVDWAESGHSNVMAVDGVGNTQGKDTSSESTPPPQNPSPNVADASSSESKQGLSMGPGGDMPATEQAPATQAMSLGEQSQHVSVSGEGQTSSGFNDWDDVSDTSPQAKAPQEPKDKS